MNLFFSLKKRKALKNRILIKGGLWGRKKAESLKIRVGGQKINLYFLNFG